MRNQAWLLMVCVICASCMFACDARGVSAENAHYTARIPAARNPGSVYSQQTTDKRATIPLPTVRYKVFVHHELKRDPKSNKDPSELHCHHKVEAALSGEMLKASKCGDAPGCGTGLMSFVLNHRDSGLEYESVKRALYHVHETWRRAGGSSVPEIEIQESTHTPRMVPSTFLSQTRNGVNEISFEEPRTKHSHTSVLSEVYVWMDTEKQTILEVDIVFHKATDGAEKIAWSVQEYVPQNKFDFYSVAMTSIGHALGLGMSDEHSHSMFAMTRRGETHKQSLECGDIAAIKKTMRSS